jgi:hypothetical protein
LKNGQKLKLGDAHESPQEISKKYKRQSLGMPPRHPLLHRQKSGHLSKHYIFIASCTMRFSWSVSCFCFVCCNKCLDHIMCLERDMLHFSFAKNAPFFTLTISPGVLLFLLLLLVFVFALICIQTLSYLFIKVYFCLWSLLVFIKTGVYKKFEWCWKREKVSCKKVVQEGACVDCGLGFFMSCLMSF